MSNLFATKKEIVQAIRSANVFDDRSELTEALKELNKKLSNFAELPEATRDKIFIEEFAPMIEAIMEIVTPEECEIIKKNLEEQFRGK